LNRYKCSASLPGKYVFTERRLASVAQLSAGGGITGQYPTWDSKTSWGNRDVVLGSPPPSRVVQRLSADGFAGTLRRCVALTLDGGRH
jgi:hypothetical protein